MTIDRREAIQPAFDALLGVVDEVVAIEEDDVRAVRQRYADRTLAVARHGDDLELGPESGKLRAQALGEQRLILGDDRARVQGSLLSSAAGALSNGRRTVTSVPPAASLAGANSKRARSP